MKRQARLDPTKLSYNFEQFGKYSNRLWEAKAKDDEKSRKFYKLVKYVRANIGDENNPVVRDFTKVQGFRPDLIEIPEDFQDLDMEGAEASEFTRKSRRKKVIKTRTSNSLTGYDAWLCFDRHTNVDDGKIHGPGNLWFAPADLVKVFGVPEESRTPKTGTGEFNFEDNNLDCFCIFDYKQT